MMGTGEKNSGLRKRQQIENAGKTMFIWVAIAAAVVGISLVLAFNLFDRIQYNQKVINAKTKTADTLHKNNEIVTKLKENIRVLNTDSSLVNTPRAEDAEPISAILDGLPSTANSSAFGASMQQKLLVGAGVSIDSLTVDPIVGVEDSSSKSSTTAPTPATGATGGTVAATNEITFKFVVSADPSYIDSMRNVLRNIEKSIRVVDLTTVTIEQQNNKITLSAEGRAFYQPEVKVQLTEKAVTR